MSVDTKDSIFHLHFEGKGTQGHVVPSTVLADSIISLQRIIWFIAAEFEGQEINQRLRPSYEMKKKYEIKCYVPEEGSYDLKYSIGNSSTLFDTENIREVIQKYEYALKAIQSGDNNTLRKAIPSSDIRRKVINELKQMQPDPRSEIVVSLEDYRRNKLLDGSTALEKLNKPFADVTPNEINPHLVIGRLDGIDFKARSFKLKLLDGHILNCTYGDEFEPILLNNAREILRVRGEATLNENNSLRSLDNITEIIEIDISPIIISSINVDGKSLQAVIPYKALVTFDREEEYYLADGDHDLMVVENTRQELEVSVHDALVFMWKEYVLCDSDSLTADAKHLRRKLQNLFGENNAT